MDSNKTKVYRSKHKDIPGNPSTAKSSIHKLNTREKGESLRVLTEEQWQFWIEKGYVVIKSAISTEQAKETAAFLGSLKKKNLMILLLGILLQEPKCK